MLGAALANIDQQRLQLLAPVGGGQAAAVGLFGQVDGIAVVVNLGEQLDGGAAAVFGLALQQNVEVVMQLLEDGFKVGLWVGHRSHSRYRVGC